MNLESDRKFLFGSLYSSTIASKFRSYECPACSLVTVSQTIRAYFRQLFQQFVINNMFLQLKVT